MTLVEVKQHMMRVKVASLASLSLCLQTEPTLLRQMLCHWERKGCVRKFKKTDLCGSQCQQCLPDVTEIYEWM